MSFAHVLCIFLGPQQTLNGGIKLLKRQHFRREMTVQFFPPLLLLSGSHAAPYLTCHNLNQITCAQLAARTMWPTSARKAPPFEIGRGFSHGSCLQRQCVCVCVCVRTLGENLPPPLLLPPPSLSFLPPLHYPPFLLFFFFPPPPILWNTVSHFR